MSRRFSWVYLCFPGLQNSPTLRIFLFHTMLPVVLERSRGLLRIRRVVSAVVVAASQQLAVQRWLAPHLRLPVPAAPAPQAQVLIVPQPAGLAAADGAEGAVAAVAAVVLPMMMCDGLLMFFVVVMMVALV